MVMRLGSGLSAPLISPPETVRHEERLREHLGIHDARNRPVSVLNLQANQSSRLELNDRKIRVANDKLADQSAQKREMPDDHHGTLGRGQRIGEWPDIVVGRKSPSDGNAPRRQEIVSEDLRRLFGPQFAAVQDLIGSDVGRGSPSGEPLDSQPTRLGQRSFRVFVLRDRFAMPDEVRNLRLVVIRGHESTPPFFAFSRALCLSPPF